jgi:hypothetical protein
MALRSKLRIYQAVYDFNCSLERTIANLKDLEALKIFPRRVLRDCRARIEALRAETNRQLTEVLNLQAERDVARLRRIRRKRLDHFR